MFPNVGFIVLFLSCVWPEKSWNPFKSSQAATAKLKGSASTGSAPKNCSSVSVTSVYIHGHQDAVEWGLRRQPNECNLNTGSSSYVWDWEEQTMLYFKQFPLWHYFVIVSDISSGSIYTIYLFTFFYSGILSDILFWHSFLAFYLAFILTSYLASFLASILAFSLTFYLAFFLIIYLASILTFPLAYVSSISSDIFSGILSGIASETLCGWGPAGITLIQRVLFGSDGEHCDRKLAVEVRRRTLWSWAYCSGPCCSGPAGNIAI